jgi:hypothetical protein
MTHEALYQRACSVIPGGVNSPVRAFNAVGGTPIFVKSGKGAEITLADGRTLIDCCCSWGAMILGHASPLVTEAVTKAAASGTTFGIGTPGEVDLAERLVAASPLCLGTPNLSPKGVYMVAMGLISIVISFVEDIGVSSVCYNILPADKFTFSNRSKFLRGIFQRCKIHIAVFRG